MSKTVVHVLVPFGLKSACGVDPLSKRDGPQPDHLQELQEDSTLQRSSSGNQQGKETMIKLMVPVVRDLIAETAGIPTSVGSSVEVVKKIPKYSLLRVSVPGMGNPRAFPVRSDVYLVNAPKTRWMKGKTQCDEAIVMFQGYVGNDIYSAEELGL